MPPPPIVKTRKTQNFQRKIRAGQEPFSYQKSIQLLKKGFSIQKIAELRKLKVGTIWEHVKKGIASNHLSIYTILLKEKIFKILFHIHSKDDTLKEIKGRIPDQTITYNEIACVFAYYKRRNRKSKNKRTFLAYQGK